MALRADASQQKQDTFQKRINLVFPTLLVLTKSLRPEKQA